MFRSKCIKPYLKKYAMFYFLGIIGLIVVDVLQLYIPLLIGEITDGLASGGFTQGDILSVLKRLIIIGIIIVLGRFIWRFFIFGTSRKIEYHLRNDFFSHLEKLSLRYFNEHKTGDLMAYATNDLNAIRMAIGPGLLMVVDTILLTVLILYKMFTKINVRLTLISIIPLPIIAGSALFLGKLIRDRFKERQEAFAALTDKVNESISGIRVIKAFVQEFKEIKAFERINKYNYDKNLKVIRLYALLQPLVGIIAGLSILIALAYGGYLTMVNVISLGDFVAFIQYILMLIWPMMALGMSINIFSQGQASLQRFQSVLDEKPEIIDAEKTEKIKKIRGNININNLTFKYPNSSVNALEGINLKINEGQTVGIVGRTGSGKTTLVNLLLRLFNPQRGQILFDNIDILDLPLDVLRNSIGYVPQDNFLFSDTITNNIIFGVENKGEEEVVEAAKLSSVHDNIMEFPEKYETVIGERGTTLSGGQKQRISIARALIRKPQILILDDSVSAVDTNTEEEILKNLRNIRKDKTTIIIAHRISTIQNADLIVVLDEGKILESGTHDQLVKNKGLYYDMYQKQQLEKALTKE